MKKGELKKQQKRIPEYVFYEANLIRAVTKYPPATQNKPRELTQVPLLVNKLCLGAALIRFLLWKMSIILATQKNQSHKFTSLRAQMEGKTKVYLWGEVFRFFYRNPNPAQRELYVKLCFLKNFS